MNTENKYVHSTYSSMYNVWVSVYVSLYTCFTFSYQKGHSYQIKTSRHLQWTQFLFLVKSVWWPKYSFKPGLYFMHTTLMVSTPCTQTPHVTWRNLGFVPLTKVDQKTRIRFMTLFHLSSLNDTDEIRSQSQHKRTHFHVSWEEICL